MLYCVTVYIRAVSAVIYGYNLCVAYFMLCNLPGTGSAPPVVSCYWTWILMCYLSAAAMVLCSITVCYRPRVSNKLATPEHWVPWGYMLCHLSAISTGPLSAAATGGVVLLDTDHVVLPVSQVYSPSVSWCYRWCCVNEYRYCCVTCQLGLQVPRQLLLQVVLWYYIQILLCCLSVMSTGPLSAAATCGVVLLDTDHVVLLVS